MPSSETFGPFELAEPIGEGGMGVVYRAVHATTGMEAAVKILTADYTARERYRRSFRREAQALAKLNHPGIADILDFGTLDAPLDVGNGELAAGTPWLAMAYVDGPALGEAVDAWRWPQVEDFILTLLDALAHAHAHDVVHRDIKPSNILVDGSQPDPANAVKLVDFGIARLREDAEETEQSDRIQGTPKYMAPEQIRRRARDQGPWTDLYSLGCLIWRLLCGQAPFAAETTREVLQRHLSNRPETFDPLIDVPDRLHDWLRRMLVKDPAARFRRAADAAWSLVQLSRPQTASRRGPTTEQLTALEASEQATTVTTPTHPAMSGPAADEPIEAIADELTVAPEAPPLPDDWRRGDDEPTVRPVAGGGLALFGLRRLPLVGREAERDLLWREMSATRRTDAPRLVMLTGPAGSGKSRLVAWLTHRVRELGAARVLQANHSRGGTAREGIGPMFARHFDCVGLDWDEAFERVRRRLIDIGVPEETIIHDTAGLLDWMGIEGDGTQEEAVGFQSRREANLASRRIIARLAARRPVIIWLDDLLWNRRSVGWMEFLLEQPPDTSFPVFLVATSRHEASEERPELADRLQRVDGPVERLEVPPLDPADHRRLIDQTLALEEQLVDEIAERTEGTPLFAIQLLEEWVERGWLVDGPSGFRLAEEAEPSVPDGLHQLWIRRLNGALSPFAREPMAAVKLAAALGQEVDRREWRAVCRRRGVDPPQLLQDHLVEAGLAEPVADGWRFVHRMLVESIERESEADGDFATNHAAIAATLADLYPDDYAHSARRRADHLVQAGSPEAALEPMLTVAHHHKERGDQAAVIDQVDRRNEIIDQLGLPAEDRRRYEGAMLRCRAMNIGGQTTEARRIAEDIREVARRHGWHRLLGTSLLEMARLNAAAGDTEAALANFDEAISAFRAVGSTEGVARSHLGRGVVLSRAGRPTEAIEAIDRAEELAERANAPIMVVGARLNRLHVWVRQDRYAEADARHESLLDYAQKLGLRHPEASLWNLAGEIGRYQHDWRRARGCYQRARQIYADLESRSRYIAKLNLAMVDFGDGKYERARAQFAELADELIDVGLRSRIGRVLLGLAGCAAGLGEWQLWERTLRELESELESNENRDRDDTWLAERAAELALEAGESDRGRRMLRLAGRLWRDLDRPQRAAEIDERLAGLA